MEILNEARAVYSEIQAVRHQLHRCPGLGHRGVETTRPFPQEGLESVLAELDTGRYGAALRAKAIVKAADGRWLHFDYVPEDHQVRFGGADYTGRLCVIGSKLDEAGLHALFGV